MSSMYWGMKSSWDSTPGDSGFDDSSNGGRAIRHDRPRGGKLARRRSWSDHRKRPAGERRQRLGRDPHRRLATRPGVVHGAARADERAEKADRRAAAVAVQLRGVAPGGDEALD